MNEDEDQREAELLELDSEDQKKRQEIEAELAADRARLQEEATPSVYDTLNKHFVSTEWPGWKAYRLEVSANVISYFM